MPAHPVILDSVLTDADRATVPVSDLGLLRGDGAFEVCRVYRGRIFALEDHLARLERTAGVLRLDVDVEAVRADALALARLAPGDADVALRVLVTRGGRRVGLLEALADHSAPLRLASVTYAPTRILDQAKTLSYAANMLAVRLAREAGGDDALLVTPHGRVLESSTSALFAVLADGTLATPPLSDHVLDSITRRRLLGLVEVDERPIARAELDGAQELFLASTLREVQAVSHLDDVALSAAPGPRTAEAAQRFAAHVAEHLGG